MTTLHLDKDFFVIENTTASTKRNIAYTKGNMTIIQDKKTCHKYENLKVNVTGAKKTEIKVVVDYELVEKIPHSGKEFCESCVITDPNDRLEARMSLYIKTGCSKDVCETDLKVVSASSAGDYTMNENVPSILGSFTNFTTQYNVSSLAEPSFATNLGITILTQGVKFSTRLASCKIALLRRNVMNCLIKSGGSIKKNEMESIKINFDIADFQGDLLEIKAEVSSVGNEINPRDNVVKNSFNFFENSTVLIGG